MAEDTSLKQAVRTAEVLQILNVTRTVENGLVRMFDAALDRCTLDDVNDAYARFRDLAERNARAAERMIEDFGGDVQELAEGFPSTSFVDAFEGADRSGLKGTFHDMLDCWFITHRSHAQWSVLKHVARNAGHEELLRIAEEAAEELQSAEAFLEHRAEEVAVDLALLAESALEEGEAREA